MNEFSFAINIQTHPLHKREMTPCTGTPLLFIFPSQPTNKIWDDSGKSEWVGRGERRWCLLANGSGSFKCLQEGIWKTLTVLVSASLGSSSLVLSNHGELLPSRGSFCSLGEYILIWLINTYNGLKTNLSLLFRSEYYPAHHTHRAQATPLGHLLKDRCSESIPRQRKKKGLEL